MGSIRNSRRAFLAATGCLAATAGCTGWILGSKPSFDELAADAPVSVDWAHEEVEPNEESVESRSMKNTAVQFQPRRVGDTIVFGTGERVVAVDPDDGSVRWRYVDEGFLTSRPVRHDGSLIVGGDRLTALSERTGDVVWTVELDTDSSGRPRETGGIGATTDSLFVGYQLPRGGDSLAEPGLVRVDADDREIVDRYDELQTVQAPPATDDEFAVAVDGNVNYATSRKAPPSVTAYDSGGHLYWRYEFEHPHTRIGPVLTSSRVFAASHGHGFDGGSVVAIDRESGDVEWRAERDIGPSTRTALSLTDDLVTFLDGENHLVALERDTGDEVWTVDLAYYDVHDERHGSHRTVQTPVVDGDRGYCTVLGALFAIDLAAGEVEWAYADEETPFAGRPLADDERLFVPSGTSFFALSV
ncbi:PQQ-binding-like beta-propeller repeat protein [Halovivax gelatinilyticus]|uniref:outer membrane protein assembly factor BamB family protein n=1 Tax=Halovivax gelatinilyticus TaxID=2961597 RepID=UPI0020CA8E09|nr:PQQ-binding-like beta-propeller repeat protein [Halovivax gelatinilyticus]